MFQQGGYEGVHQALQGQFFLSCHAVDGAGVAVERRIGRQPVLGIIGAFRLPVLDMDEKTPSGFGYFRGFLPVEVAQPLQFVPKVSEYVGVGGGSVQTGQPALQSVLHRLLGGEAHFFLVPIVRCNILIVGLQPSFRRLNAPHGLRPMVGVVILFCAVVFQGVVVHHHSIGVGLAGDVLLGQPVPVELLPGHRNDVIVEVEPGAFAVGSDSGVGGGSGRAGVVGVGDHQQVNVRVAPVVAARPRAEQDHHRRVGRLLSRPRYRQAQRVGFAESRGHD